MQQPRLLQAISLALAVLVTWVWVLGAAGSIGPGIVLGWWLAWSVYELVVRMRCKPYVKDGPWWGRDLRPASWADMATYVGVQEPADRRDLVPGHEERGRTGLPARLAVAAMAVLTRRRTLSATG